MGKPQIEALALLALPGACLFLLVFAVAGLGCFLYGHFSGVAQMAHFGKVIMAPFGLALCAVFLIEICLWLCGLILYAIDRMRRATDKTVGTPTSRLEVTEQAAAKPELNSELNPFWYSAPFCVIVFSMALAVIGLGPLLRGVYQQERGLIVVGVWLVAPYALLVAAWYIAIQIWHLTSGIDQMKAKGQAK